MGWSLFRKKKPVLRLAISEVEGWLVSYQESIGLDVHIATFGNRVRRLFVDAQLLNETIAKCEVPEGLESKEQLVVKGHLQSLAKRFSLFVQTPTVTTDRSEILSFAENLSERLVALEEAINPEIFALQEYLPALTKDVKGLLFSFDAAVVDLRSAFEHLGMTKIDTIYRRMEEYRQGLQKREGLQEAIAKEKERKVEPLEKLEKIKKRIAELKSSNGFRFIVDREAELESLDQEQESLRSELKRVFKPLKEVLLKASPRDKKLLNDYIKKPLQAIVDDEKLLVVKCLGRLKKKIDNADASLVELFGVVDEQWCFKIQKQIDDITQKRESIKASLKRDTTRMLLSEQLDWEKSMVENLEQIEKNISMLNDELSNLSPQLLLQRVRDQLRHIRKDVEVYV